MTSMEEFLEECVEGEEADATRIEGATQQREAERYSHLAEYHLKGVEDHLKGEAKLLAIRQGYYAMLHQTNAALALAGFKTGSHICAIKGLSAVFESSDLADDLRRAGEERINVDYNIDPDSPSLEEFDSAKEFVDNVMHPFLEKIDKLLQKKGLITD